MPAAGHSPTEQHANLESIQGVPVLYVLVSMVGRLRLPVFLSTSAHQPVPQWGLLSARPPSWDKHVLLCCVPCGVGWAWFAQPAAVGTAMLLVTDHHTRVDVLHAACFLAGLCSPLRTSRTSGNRTVLHAYEAPFCLQGFGRGPLRV